jgi:hypothetical protein
MTRTLSPIQNGIINAAWALGFLLVVLVLAQTVGIRLDDSPVLYGLLLLGPVLSAAFCHRLLGVLLGAIGFGTGVVLAALLTLASTGSANVDWGRVAVLVPLVSLAGLAAGIPVWWCTGRFRRMIAATTSTA